ncbi:hypothetical protein GLOTRDRAFT_70807 [Gloeophyllum trabeum ATCC 11539]|uniref:Protein EFR3 n=1 Tax=Gloeophyllum trabeum (strain ATCC 11539 / FP-39264 / Madison 617) TaxID=670483 RepID=S7QJ50_GLOTA|nr:uncharacterized protein GLOTRDRAFT_70807 [Gloeophyllum trabeum ATCC 11539]EPQ59402.1 hypothetical protein GLOTRDRAFT_70807 [Gloeophyllum trabeum ATCC 11539]
MHIPFTPNHVQLITACYPPSAALLNSGPEYRPNSQELSRLTYYAANRPGKITKLGSELEKRVRADCRRAQAGNTRARASLLITLSILKALATECRRDISLLSSSLLSSVLLTITSLSSDLEVLARAATLFVSWTTYTDGHLIGVDSGVTRDYLASLKQFAEFSRANGKARDAEVRNRTRLVGLSALSGAVTSEALYTASQLFREQVSFITSAVLVTVFEVRVLTLDKASLMIKEKPASPYLSEFRTRPPNERRAASIHVHVDGDKGPSMEDVTEACLRVLSSVFEHSNATQVGSIMQSLFDSLEDTKGWEKPEHCCWLARKAADWTQYQYRYAVPTRLVERLLEGQDAPITTALHSSLAAMITAVFTSPTPLVNLSTSDIISNLMTLLLRRVAIDPEDAVLPAVVGCISSLGMHVYYADQIQDLAAELISRLTVVEINGLPPGGGKADKEKCRATALRCLLSGLTGLMRAADSHSSGDASGGELAKDHSRAGGAPSHSVSPKVASPTDGLTGGDGMHVKPSRRTKISPEVWQDTLTLLCDGDYGVRANYAQSVLYYLENEMPKRGDSTDADGVRRVRPLAEGPIRQASNASVALVGDGASRFLNALHSYLYVLATASSLGLNGGSISSLSGQSANGDLSVDDSRTENGTGTSEDVASQNHRRSMAFPPRQRKASIAQHLIQRTSSRISASASATASDYAHILAILSSIHQQLPVRALLTGVPMLLALDAASRVDSSEDDTLKSRQAAINEIVAKVWIVIGKVWDCPEITDVISKAIPSLDTPFLPAPPNNLDDLHSPRPVLFSQLDPPPGSLLSSDLDVHMLLACLSSSRNAAEATGLDQEALQRRLSVPWTPESAMKDSIERPSNYDALRGESILKIAPTLMHVENLSLQSLGRFTRGVGVTDLREALEGRNSMSNPALVNGAPSISTFDHSSLTQAGDGWALRPTRSRPARRPQTAGPSEVRDVLNKLGIGKQNGNSLLKASLSPLPKTDNRYARMSA